MKIPRFYCPQLDVGRPVLDASQSRHARLSLRLREATPVCLFDGRGRTARGTIVAPDGSRPKKQAVHVRVERVDTLPPPQRTLTLIVAGCKGSRLSWMVEKCTELGTTTLALAEFERSVVHVSDGHIRKLHKTAIEACKQCGRAWLPKIHCGSTPDEFVASSTFDGIAVAHPDASAPTFAEWLGSTQGAGEAAAEARQRKPRAAGRRRQPGCVLAVVIGPEGGLSENELERFCGLGGQFVRLAEHTLRVETAAVAVSALWAAG